MGLFTCAANDQGYKVPCSLPADLENVVQGCQGEEDDENCGCREGRAIAVEYKTSRIVDINVFSLRHDFKQQDVKEQSKEERGSPGLNMKRSISTARDAARIGGGSYKCVLPESTRTWMLLIGRRAYFCCSLIRCV